MLATLPLTCVQFTNWLHKFKVEIKLFSVFVRTLHARGENKARNLWIIYGYSTIVTVTNIGLKCLLSKPFLESWMIVNLNMRLGRDPKNHGHRRPCILAFLPNHWKQPWALPTMVYGILVQTLLGPWRIVNLKLRLGGDPNKHGWWQPYISAFLTNVENNHQHIQRWVMVFWSNISGGSLWL